MKRFICILVVILFVVAGSGCRKEQPGVQYIMPVSTVRNDIRISVDPKVELISIVQYLSSYDELMTGAEFKYRSDVDAYFSGFRNHEAVSMLEDMTSWGFMFSTPANFALSLTTGLYIDESVDFGDHVLWGGGGEQNLKDFAAALRDFSVESSFHKFYADHEDYYRKNVHSVLSLMGERDYVTEIQDYYGLEYNSFTIIPVILYGEGCAFGPHVDRSGQIDAYCILCPFDSEMQGEIPLYGTESTIKLMLRHEFSHSYVNRITDMYIDEVMALEYMFRPIQAEMEEMKYGSWETCLNEHIVRAVTTRLAYSDSVQEGERALEREVEQGFIYTGVLVEALLEYENDRDTYQNFMEFYLELLDALEGAN